MNQRAIARQCWSWFTNQLVIKRAGRGLGNRQRGRPAVAGQREAARKGRRERAVDPAAGPLQAFAHQLRELRRAAGSPSYRELARRAHFSDTSLSVAASGADLPSLEVTLGYVRACGGDIAEWERRWRQVARQHGAGSPSSFPAGDAAAASTAAGQAGRPAAGAARKDRPDVAGDGAGSPTQVAAASGTLAAEAESAAPHPGVVPAQNARAACESTGQAAELLERDALPGTAGAGKTAAAPGLRYSLPPDTAAFTGRGEELAVITAYVTDVAQAGAWWRSTRSAGFLGWARPRWPCTPPTSCGTGFLTGSCSSTCTPTLPARSQCCRSGPRKACFCFAARRLTAGAPPGMRRLPRRR